MEEFCLFTVQLQLWIHGGFENWMELKEGKGKGLTFVSLH